MSLAVGVVLLASALNLPTYGFTSDIIDVRLASTSLSSPLKMSPRRAAAAWSSSVYTCKNVRASLSSLGSAPEDMTWYSLPCTMNDDRPGSVLSTMPVEAHWNADWYCRNFFLKSALRRSDCDGSRA
jgi:hypothetical protein